MHTVSDIENFQKECPLILTIGMYDGVHHGHQEIIKLLNQQAQKVGGKSGLLTFSPHPRLVLQKNSKLNLLTLQEEKVKLLDQFGLNYLFLQKFDLDFASKSAQDFVKEVLVEQLNVHTLIIGHDHHFGKNREGNLEQLTQMSQIYGFQVKQLEAITENAEPISSTKIRNALLNGDLDYANKALNHPYQITGTVIHGDKIGRTLGFPTANLEVADLKLIPKDGVYAVQLTIDHKPYFGLLSLGTRPTLNKTEHRVEVYILDFQGDLYGQELTLEFLFRIRDDQKFESLEAMISEIQKDEHKLRNYINSH